MQRKIHMHDQVRNNVKEVMNYYNRRPMELWLLKLAVMGACFLIGMYSRGAMTVLG